MKKTIIMLFVLLGSAVIISSCRNNDDNYKMSNYDFVVMASSSNMLEIAAGNLAINKGVNANVKAYGQHMVHDHSETATQMSALASSKGWTVPTSMVNYHQEMYNSLASLNGSAFDKQFASVMVASHQEAVSLFENISQRNGVPDADLRAFAAGKLPTLRTHLTEAQTLKAQVN
jgi:putative membrane protein